MIKPMEHIKYMKLALKEAQKANDIDEVPIGAVIIKDGIVISKAHNLREKNQSATAHAEVIAINKACKKLNSWRLEGCILYVTLEPCTMCIGASILSRVDGIVYGAKDPKGGSLGSLYDISLIKGFNHYPWVVSGICEDESSNLLKEFFKNKRKNGINSKL
jgi:tRNA(adenine34) deaminase